MTAGAGCLPGCGRARGHGRSRPLRACRLGAGESLRLIPLLAAARVCTTRAGPRENPQFRARSGVPGGAAEAWAGLGGGRGGGARLRPGPCRGAGGRLAHPGLRWRGGDGGGGQVLRIVGAERCGGALGRVAGAVAEQPALSFAGLLRQLRAEARLTQEELAEAAKLSPRSVSDLERGISRTARKETALLLADALGLAGPVRVVFVAAARGKAPAAEVQAATLGVPSLARHNLPAPLTSFVGREQDLARLEGLLGQARLVTLTGPGGAGKTRLALEFASGVLGRFPDGAWLVDLASLSDASLIAAAALSAVGAPGQPGRPAIDTLTDFLIRRRTLVVLDNCEHLLDGCAELVGRLLCACPDVKVLATTREAMNIPGEVLWKVRPLTIPDGDCALDGLQSSEAVALFTDRTRAVEPDFEITTQNAGAVTQICRRLDGMPLAIELAASRVRSMAVQELSSRLDDRFHLLTGGTRTALPRQRTLEATITWSYDLLSEEERVVF